MIEDGEHTDQNWALLTFTHEKSVKKSLQELQSGTWVTPMGAVLKVAEATPDMVIKYNATSVAHRNHWTAQDGMVNTAMAAEQQDKAALAIRETPEQVAARLARSFKTHAFNVERGSLRSLCLKHLLLCKLFRCSCNCIYLAGVTVLAKRTDLMGGNAEYQVAWQGAPLFTVQQWLVYSPTVASCSHGYPMIYALHIGCDWLPPTYARMQSGMVVGRFVSPSWLSQEVLEGYPITWGMVQEWEENEQEQQEKHRTAEAMQLQRAAGL